MGSGRHDRTPAYAPRGPIRKVRIWALFVARLGVIFRRMRMGPRNLSRFRPHQRMEPWPAYGPFLSFRDEILFYLGITPPLGPPGKAFPSACGMGHKGRRPQSVALWDGTSTLFGIKIRRTRMGPPSAYAGVLSRLVLYRPLVHPQASFDAATRPFRACYVPL